MTLTRRQFLRNAGALGATVALGACASDDGPDALAPATTGTAHDHPATSTTVAAAPATSAAPAAAPSGGDGALVVLTLYGGNDALNTVVPVGDPAYTRLRGELAVDPATALDIGDGFALHPALPQCKALWDAGRLAIVHGVGFDALDRSHFHCMDVWQSGGEHDFSTGWLGRWLDASGDDPLDAIAVGRRLPLLARGARRSAAVVPSGPFELPGDAAFRAAVSTLAGADAGRPELAGLVAASTADLLAVVDTVAPVMAGSQAGEGLTAALDSVATLLDAGLPARVYAVELGGFDTHAAQTATHEALLGEVDAALGAFFERVVDRPVTVLVYSEFGRRVTPNASAGTDHGAAGVALVAGNVVAGHHGEPSPLDRLVDGDLATTVDFRAVYGGLLEGVFGVDAAAIVGPGVTPLTLV